MRVAFVWVACMSTLLGSATTVAQTDGGRFSTPLRVTTTAARPYVAAEVRSIGPVEVPMNLVMSSMYRSFVESLLADSPTFRRQCERLANTPGLTIRLNDDIRRQSSPQNPALTTIRTRGSARVIAEVQINQFGREAELLAHEFEHIIEFLDGVDLKSKAKVSSTGVRGCACGNGSGAAFETRRAIHVGRIVAREVQDAHDKR